VTTIRTTATSELAWQLEQLEHHLAKLEFDKNRTVEHINRICAELRRRIEEGEG